MREIWWRAEAVSLCCGWLAGGGMGVARLEIGGLGAEEEEDEEEENKGEDEVGTGRAEGSRWRRAVLL